MFLIYIYNVYVAFIIISDVAAIRIIYDNKKK